MALVASGRIHSPESGYTPDVNDFNVDLLTVVGVLVGLSTLLFLLSAMDPTTQRLPRTIQQPHRETATPVPLRDVAHLPAGEAVRHS